MPETPGSIDARDLEGPPQFIRDVVEPCRPVILRGLVRDWPIVAAGRLSPSAVRDHLLPLDAGGEIEAFFGAPEIAGRYFYTEDLKGFNFERRRMKFAAALESIVSSVGVPGSASIYVGSVPTSDFLPRFASLNPMPLLDPGIGPRVWIGHAANVSSHYDTVDNLACVAVGTRRFTLFAPRLTHKLYVGPIDNTMAGQPVSLAASSAPDKDRFPLFEEVKDQSLVADLTPGDAL